MTALVIWTAALALQGLALVLASAAGRKVEGDNMREAGGYILAASAIALLSLLLMVTT